MGQDASCFRWPVSESVCIRGFWFGSNRSSAFRHGGERLCRAVIRSGTFEAFSTSLAASAILQDHGSTEFRPTRVERGAAYKRSIGIFFRGDVSVGSKRESVSAWTSSTGSQVEDSSATASPMMANGSLSGAEGCPTRVERGSSKGKGGPTTRERRSSRRKRRETAANYSAFG